MGDAPPLRTVKKLLLLSESRLARETLTLALEQVQWLTVVGADSASEAERYLRDLHPDALLLQLPLIYGAPVMRRLVAASPRLPAVVVDSAENEHELFAWADAGASFCLPRGRSLGDLISALEAVNASAEHPRARDAQATGPVNLNLNDDGGSGPLAFCALGLTRRQAEVFELLVRGLSNKQIARALSVEVATVKNHVHSVLRRLEVDSRVEAIVIGQGLSKRLRNTSRV